MQKEGNSRGKICESGKKMRGMAGEESGTNNSFLS
jgi:hypothetical protein